MFGIRRPGASAESTAAGRRGGRPALTARWLRDAMFAHRLAFEREMQRDRRRLERRFEDYLEEASSRRS